MYAWSALRISYGYCALIWDRECRCEIVGNTYRRPIIRIMACISPGSNVSNDEMHVKTFEMRD